jgi:hypothetical protein
MNNWKLQFVTRSRSGERRDTATLIGVGAGAKDGDDVRDLLKPQRSRTTCMWRQPWRRSDGTADAGPEGWRRS